MKTAICYFSYHHGNTLKVAEAMAEAGDVDLIDLRIRQTVHLEEYDCIGLASGIYGFSVHKSIVDFARQYLPCLLYTASLYSASDDQDHSGSYRVTESNRQSILYAVTVGETEGMAVVSKTTYHDGGESPTLILSLGDYAIQFAPATQPPDAAGS